MRRATIDPSGVGAIFGQRVGLAVSFELAPVQDCPAMRLAQIAFEKQQIAEAKILNDPFVIQMMQEFDAKIVPGSIKTI